MKTINAKTLILLLQICLTLSAVSQTATEQWVTRYDNATHSSDVPYAITVDAAGNIYCAGISYNPDNTSDCATVKYNASGVQEWAATYNGPGNGDDYGYAVGTDASNNVYVCGYSYGIGTGYDIAIVKYNSSGVQLWAARYNNWLNTDDYAYSIHVDASGNVYVTGQFVLNGGNSSRVIILKYNTNGVLVVQTSYTGGDYDFGNYITTDAAGNIYTTGVTSADANSLRHIVTLKHSPWGAPLWSNVLSAESDNEWPSGISLDAEGNVYVAGNSSNYFTAIKYNSAGVQQWVSQHTNTTGYLSAMACDAAGNVYVAGHFNNETNSDIATIKYSSNGDEQWVATYSGGSASGISLDNDGNVYISGLAYNENLFEFATIKYSISGVEQWVRRYNGPGNGENQITAIKVDCSKNVIVTGFSTGIGTNLDFATVKYSQNGTASTVSAGSDTVIYLGYGPQSITLTATPSGGSGSYSYVWSPGGQTTQSITVSPVTTTNYTVTINPYSCPASDSVKVTVYDTRCGNNGNKVLVCHNGITICISPEAVAAHLNHGDLLGSCDLTPDNQIGMPLINIPGNYMLHANYPNPFNPETNIKFDLPFESSVNLIIYDITGKEVSVLINESKPAGYHSVTFEASHLSSGVYFYRLEAKENASGNIFSSVKKMLLVK